MPFLHPERIRATHRERQAPLIVNTEPEPAGAGADRGRLWADAVGGDYGLLDDGLFGETDGTRGLPDSVDLYALHRAALVSRHLRHVLVGDGNQDDLQVHALRRGGQDEADAGLSSDVLRVEVNLHRGDVPQRPVQLRFAGRGEHVRVEQFLDVEEGGTSLFAAVASGFG